MITLKRLSSAGNPIASSKQLLRYLTSLKSQAEQQQIDPSSLDEYYTTEQQKWIVAGADVGGSSLVADGSTIVDEEFVAILQGRDPRTGEQIASQSDKRSPGTDMTFAPSKGVSILWAASDADTRKKIEAELHQASRRTLDYAVRSGFFETRRGSGSLGTQVNEPVAQIIAASFVHASNREGDPDLHQHTVIANLALTKDGQYRALDFKPVFDNQKILSARFDAELAHCLRKAFGLGWDRNGKNNIEVAGIPAPLIATMSQRKQQIDALAGDHASQAMRDVAWADSRQDKNRIDTPDMLESRWSAQIARHMPFGVGAATVQAPAKSDLEQALALRGAQRQVLANSATAGHQPAAGLDLSRSIQRQRVKMALASTPLPQATPLAVTSPDQARQTDQSKALFGWVNTRAATAKKYEVSRAKTLLNATDYLSRDDQREAAQIQREATIIAGSDGSAAHQVLALSLATALRHSSAIDRRELIQQGYLLAAQQGVDPAAVEAALPSFLASANVLSGDVTGQDVSLRAGLVGVTTLAAAQDEHLIQDVAKAGVGRVANISFLVADQDGVDKLSAEQRTAVEVALAGNQISVIEGRAGVGKTTSANVLLSATEAAGYKSLLLAASHKASNVLAEESGRKAMPIQSLLANKEAIEAIDSRTLIMLDEAGMVGRSDMAQLLAVASERGARVVIQGDRNQLESPGGGSPLQLIADEVKFAQISTVRRQKVEWMALATEKMSSKRADQAMAEYADRGHISMADTADQAIDQAADKYMDYREQGSVLAVARTRNEVAALNSAIRDRLIARGELGEILGVELARQTKSGGKSDVVEMEIRAGDRIKIGEKTAGNNVSTGDHATVIGRDAAGNYLMQFEGEAEARRIDWRTLSADNWDDKESGLRAPVGRRSKVAKSKPIATPKVDHNYASTIHGSQGATVDRAVLLAGSQLGGREAYVAASRHRDDLTIVVDKSRLIKKMIAADPDRKIEEINDGELTSDWTAELRLFNRAINASDIISKINLDRHHNDDRDKRQNTRNSATNRGPTDGHDAGTDRRDRPPIGRADGVVETLGRQGRGGSVGGGAASDSGKNSQNRSSAVSDRGQDRRDRSRGRGR